MKIDTKAAELLDNCTSVGGTQVEYRGDFLWTVCVKKAKGGV